MKPRNQDGFAMIFEIILVAAVITAIGFAGWRALSSRSQRAAKVATDFVYERKYPSVIKGILDPGSHEVTKLLTDELTNVKALGANTIYIYVDYSYQNGVWQYSQRGRDSSASQTAIEQELVDNIKLAKQKDFAVHLTLAFGGGQNTRFNVPVEQLLKDIEAADLKWASIGEQYKVEYYAPSSEIDYQIFREYYGGDWDNKASHKEATEISNRYHDDVLPKLRPVFRGKLIYQAGLWSPYSGSKGYDIFGMGVNSVGREVSNFRELVQEIFGYAQTNAKRQGGDWMITELWIPVNQNNVPSKTPSGTPYTEIQADLYKIVFEEYQKLTGQTSPVGLSFTSYLGAHAKVKDTPAETVIKDFFNSI